MVCVCQAILFFLPSILARAVAEHSAQLLSRRALHAAPPLRTSRRPGQQYLPDSSLPQCRHPLCHGTPGHPLCLGAPASHIFPMAFRHGAPTSNKPHLAEKSTPVWLAIWRTWAGFANSQLLPDAAAAAPSRALSAESPRSGNFSAQTSASLHPSRSASLAGPSHSRGHGRPRSVRKSYRLREKCLFTELLLVVRGAVPANHRARFQNANTS